MMHGEPGSARRQDLVEDGEGALFGGGLVLAQEGLERLGCYHLPRVLALLNDLQHSHAHTLPTRRADARARGCVEG